MVDTGGPETERQARFLDAHGQTRRPKETDPTARAMNYTVAIYEKLTLPERRDFVGDMQSLLAEMEQRLEQDLVALAGSPVTLVNPSPGAVEQ